MVRALSEHRLDLAGHTLGQTLSVEVYIGDLPLSMGSLQNIGNRHRAAFRSLYRGRHDLARALWLVFAILLAILNVEVGEEFGRFWISQFFEQLTNQM